MALLENNAGLCQFAGIDLWWGNPTSRQQRMPPRLNSGADNGRDKDDREQRDGQWAESARARRSS